MTEASLAATMLKPATEATWPCPIYEPGQVIAERYTVEQRFEGGMGYVYITLDQTQNLRFAIKQPKAWMLTEPALLARVTREADAWTRLGMHPHIAYCYFVRTLNGVPHIFVEYVDGGNLREWIAAGRCIDYRASLDLAIQCCQGMERAHGWGMVHRDLKPENILVSRDGQAKITDFGLVGDLGIREDAAGTARPEASALATQFGMQMGTPVYMAPEQWRDPRRRGTEAPDGVDCDSDVYSFGVCLWEMICGRLPYPSALADAELPDPHRSRRDLPASLGQLLKQVVDRDRRGRPADFGVLRKRLNAIHRELFHDDAPAYRIDLPDTGAAELNNQGYSYAELGKSEQALACFRQAVEKDPTQPQAVYNLALRQWRAAEIDDLEAVQRVENCRNNPTVDPAVVAELVAQFHAERADLDAAQASLRDYPGRYEALFAAAAIKPTRCLHTLKPPNPVNLEFVRTIAVTQDGRYAASGCQNTATLRLWDLVEGRCLHTLEGHTGAINTVAFAGDERQILSASHDKTLKLWDLATGQCLRTLEGHPEPISAMAVVGGGSQAVSVSRDGTLKLWDLATGQCLRTSSVPFLKWAWVAVAPDGRQVLAAGAHGETLRLLALFNNHCLHVLEEHRARASSAMTITADGRYAVAGSESGTLKLWDLGNGQCLRTLTGHAAFIDTVVVEEEGRYAVSGAFDKTLRLWDLHDGRCLRTLKHDREVGAVAMMSDGRRVVASNGAGLKLWELSVSTYRAALHLARPQNFADKQRDQTNLQRALAQVDHDLELGRYREASKALLTAWQDLGFREEEILQRRYTHLLSRGNIAELLAAFRVRTLHIPKGTGNVAMTADGRHAVSGGGDTLQLWDLATGNCSRTLTVRAQRSLCTIRTVAMTADGRYALSGGDEKTLKLWDLATGDCLRTLEGHTKAIHKIVVTGDGRWAVSASYDSTLRVWDLHTGQCLRILEGYDCHSARVAITASGRYVISGSEDGRLKLWDLSGEPGLRILEGHEGATGVVGLSQDGRRMLSTGHAKMKEWDLPSGQCLRSWNINMGLYAHQPMALMADERHALWINFLRRQDIGLWDLASEQCRSLATLTGHMNGVETVAVAADGSCAVSGSHDGTLVVWRFIWDLEFPDQDVPNTTTEAPPQAVSLQKGHRLSLSKAAPNLKKSLVGLGWTLQVGAGAECDVDASAFLLGADGKVRSDADVVFYNQPQSACGSVQLTDADRADGDKRALMVDLDRVPAEVQRIAFTVTIHEAEQRRQNFGQVRDAYIRLIDAETHREIARYDLGGDARTETALIFGELYRHGGEWRFSAVGQGYAGGLAALCRRYGVDV